MAIIAGNANGVRTMYNRIYFILFMMAAEGGGGMKKKVNGHLPLKKIKIDSRRPLIVIGDLHVRNIKTFNG